MASNIDVDELSGDPTHFLPVSVIDFETPIVQLVESCIRWQSAGVPFAIKGIPLEGRESPFFGVENWLARLPQPLRERAIGGNDANGDDTATTTVCPPEWSGWLHTSYLIPNCLVPQGSADIFPKGTVTTSCQLGVNGDVTRFEDSHHGTSGNFFLCFGEPGSSVDWFLTAAADSQRVFEYLQSLQVTSPRQLDLEHLSNAPFDVYTFKQEIGDLVVLPPRIYHQRLFQGTTASCYWSRMTIDGLRYAVFYDFYRRQRLCWPAEHRVKQLAYDTMCSRFAELEASEESLSLSDALELKQLLEMVDEILRVEAYTNDEEIPTFIDTPTNLFCAFCGGEVFQKVFCCKSKCLREGAIDPTPANIISICPSCYIDGPLVASRNEVAAWLRSNSKELLLNDDSEDDMGIDGDRRDIIELGPDNLVGETFLAALLLCLARDDSPGSKRTCTVRNGQPSHQVDKHALLNCGNCHASRCYQHILSTLNIHSSQAVLVYYTTESSSDVWHRHHVDLKRSYLDSYPQLLSDMVSGSYHPLNHRLAYFSLHFTVANPVSRNTVQGFYDVGEILSNTRTDSRKKKKNARSTVRQKRTTNESSTPEQQSTFGSDDPDGSESTASDGSESMASEESESTILGRRESTSSEESESTISDRSESTGSRSPQLPVIRSRLTKKRSRGSTSESEGKIDTFQPKRPRVYARVEGDKESRLSPQTERRISEALLTKDPPTTGKGGQGSKSRRVNQVLSSSPEPEDDELTHSPAKALQSFDPETDLGVPKPETSRGNKFMSGWDSLLSSFGLSPSNLRTDFRSNNSNPQGVRRMKGRQGVTQEQEDNRRQHLAGTSSGPLRKADRSVQQNRVLVETRATRPPWPKPQERGLSKSRDFVGSDLRQAGGSSVPNPPLSTSLNPGGERTSGRRLRKQPSEMALSDDSVARENLLFYLDRMEAPDDEEDEDLSGTYTNRK